MLIATTRTITSSIITTSSFARQERQANEEPHLHGPPHKHVLIDVSDLEGRAPCRPPICTQRRPCLEGHRHTKLQREVGKERERGGRGGAAASVPARHTACS